MPVRGLRRPDFAMLFSTAMWPLDSRRATVPALVFVAAASISTAGCKRSEPPPDLVKSQREAMERAKEVGKTMQKAVDAEGKKADEEGK
jgi:hypothetical protein